MPCGYKLIRLPQERAPFLFADLIGLNDGSIAIPSSASSARRKPSTKIQSLLSARTERAGGEEISRLEIVIIADRQVPMGEKARVVSLYKTVVLLFQKYRKLLCS